MAAVTGLHNISSPVAKATAAAPSYTEADASGLSQDLSGNLRTIGTISGTVTANNPLGITPTDRTIVSMSGSSQTLMAANAARHSMTVVNTGSSNIGVNPTGTAAVIGGAGTITLYPGGAYTPRIPTLSAVTVIGTAAQPVYADEN